MDRKIRHLFQRGKAERIDTRADHETRQHARVSERVPTSEESVQVGDKPRSHPPRAKRDKLRSSKVDSRGSSADSVHDAIADDYQAYLPALSQSQDSSTVPEQLASDLRGLSLSKPSQVTAESISDTLWKDVGNKTTARWISKPTAKSTNDHAALDSMKKHSNTNTDHQRREEAHAFSGPEDSGAQHIFNGIPHKAQVVEDDPLRDQGPFDDSSSQDASRAQPNGSLQRPDSAFAANLDGIVDLEDSVDVDRYTRVAPGMPPSRLCMIHANLFACSRCP
jgi:hypothetical protein